MMGKLRGPAIKVENSRKDDRGPCQSQCRGQVPLACRALPFLTEPLEAR
jgi:hypothetical protein